VLEKTLQFESKQQLELLKQSSEQGHWQRQEQQLQE
jgi:hypothetical protein